jgi:hypothetical protein
VKRRLYLPIAFALCLAGCASANNRVGAGLDVYTGRPVTELIAILGTPNEETSISGQEVFVWGDARIAMLTNLHQAAGVGGENLPPEQYQCTIRVFVGPDQRIVSWDLLGNEVGCQSYAARFSHPQ